MLHRHILRASTPAEAVQLCQMNNSCSVHSDMSCVDADNSYAGSWSLTLWDDLILSRTDQIGLNYERAKTHICGDLNDSVFLHFNLGSGGIAGQQLGRDYVLSPGAGGLFVHNEPVSVGLYKGASLLGLALPRAATRRWKLAPEDLASRDIPADGFAFEMLRQYLELLTRADGLTLEAAAIAKTHMADLAGIWLGGLKDVEAPATLARQQMRGLVIRDYVGQHFRDPNLTPTSAAQALGMSRRLLQHVLTEEGLSFTHLLTEARLKHAAFLLKSAGKRQTTLIDIAFACGFNDLSTFYKGFGNRYGQSPGKFRQLAQ
ncbi:AraC family transcriptional regulator [Asticcacaulis sp. 201]|uniref:AraC family transcriptional regulator n=1 Tax=Asticcacaulis sp. 201 TaxID=3028787 RepID=UPI0029160F1D|nr:AraC family transcriptional regulator [Asticcacaulis sp. 201]MDV6331236.1 AraC family transcriptional regulator [Asticcacaulis sp. 201]